MNKRNRRLKLISETISENKEALERLSHNKDVLNIKDGVVDINSTHQDYKFWTKDD